MRTSNELSNYLQALETANQFSGVVLITQGDTRLFAGAYGYASRAWQVKNTLATRFDTASVTKLFTAVAVLQLIDQGKFAFDTGVTDFLGLQGTTIAPEVNVYHLLTHTSGIADDADEEAGESYEAIWQNKPNYSVIETVDFLPQFAYKPANFLPGQGCRYCNCGYVLLGLLIEKASGMNYRDYIKQHIFTPAKMTASAFLRKDWVHENVAEGCDPILNEAKEIIGWKKNIYAFPPIGSPDGGAYVTAPDLDRFLRAVQQGQLLSPTLTTAFLTPQVYYRTGKQWLVHYGYGLVFYLDQAGQVVSYHKEGINPGVSAIIRHLPAQDINIVLLSTLSEGVWDPVGKIYELLTEK